MMVGHGREELCPSSSLYFLRLLSLWANEVHESGLKDLLLPYFIEGLTAYPTSLNIIFCEDQEFSGFMTPHFLGLNLNANSIFKQTRIDTDIMGFSEV